MNHHLKFIHKKFIKLVTILPKASEVVSSKLGSCFAVKKRVIALKTTLTSFHLCPSPYHLIQVVQGPAVGLALVVVVLTLHLDVLAHRGAGVDPVVVILAVDQVWQARQQTQGCRGCGRFSA